MQVRWIIPSILFSQIWNRCLENFVAIANKVVFVKDLYLKMGNIKNKNEEMKIYVRLCVGQLKGERRGTIVPQENKSCYS
jgi:hypothetical protein